MFTHNTDLARVFPTKNSLEIFVVVIKKKCVKRKKARYKRKVIFVR